jgi:hypothetical protein
VGLEGEFKVTYEGQVELPCPGRIGLDVKYKQKTL